MKYRKFRAITADIFREDIPVFCPEYLESLSVDKLVNHYDFIQVQLVETHAPLHLRIGTNTSWYNDDLRDAKQERRRRDSTWRKFKLEVHTQMFIERCKLLHAKNTFYIGKD